MAIGNLVDPHNRGKGAAAKTGNFLNGEDHGGVGVILLLQFQFTSEGLVDKQGPFHMTCGAGAYHDPVLPGGFVPELGVKSRYP